MQQKVYHFYKKDRIFRLRLASKAEIFVVPEPLEAGNFLQMQKPGQRDLLRTELTERNLVILILPCKTPCNKVLSCWVCIISQLCTGQILL